MNINVRGTSHAGNINILLGDSSINFERRQDDVI